MQFACRTSRLRGEVAVPGSKSHTIRAVVVAGLAAGESTIEAPLESGDTLSCVRAMTALGADIRCQPGAWRVRGCGGRPVARELVIDTGNSGTTTLILMGTAALLDRGEVTLTGDEQIRRRPVGALARALGGLGATAVCRLGNDCPPVVVRGRLHGGRTAIEAKTSQYLTSLLLACPLGDGQSVVDVPLLNERPYVQMTLDWLASQQVCVEHDADMRQFRVPGGQAYRAFCRRVPADFSSATFFLGAGALGENQVTCDGLDMADSQADKAVVRYLREMGAEVGEQPGRISVTGRGLTGAEIDMNETPDALPVMAVLGCFARGRTVLRNVAHARIKETDRIAVMRTELARMGADITELPDGLVLRESPLHGAVVRGHGDHRVVMALALAGLSAPGQTVVDTAEAAAVTFPTFADCMRRLGGDLAEVSE